MLRVTKTAQAAQDLEDIWFHIAVDNMVAADALLDAIDDRCRVLVRQPMMGRARPELASGVRSFTVGRYVVFYCLSGAGIEVLRVLHGARDIGHVYGDE